MTEIGDDGDPRMDAEYVRRVAGEGDDGDVLLLGVVHDHPASRHRVRTVIADYDPGVVALEVAPLALPAFEAVAADRPWAPADGDEMSDAIAAAPDARTAGIDGIGAQFFATLARNLYAERPSRREVRSVLTSVAAVAKEAATYRAASLLRRYTPLRPSAGTPVEHDCDPTDPADVQAADERRQTSTSLAFLRAIQQPTGMAVRDDTRETCMIRRLGDLRADGDVAAVVGLGHVDPVAEGLTERTR
ncbi:hypothetical protein BRC81_04985 [Halobacteriales archaeon QS_1_68_20]|nr:MAG: hypothetical protein BRC81_04985 [Halobacteriales archaeon QS_1_68_20]